MDARWRCCCRFISSTPHATASSADTCCKAHSAKSDKARSLASGCTHHITCDYVLLQPASGVRATCGRNSQLAIEAPCICTSTVVLCTSAACSAKDSPSGCVRVTAVAGCSRLWHQPNCIITYFWTKCHTNESCFVVLRTKADSLSGRVAVTLATGCSRLRQQRK